MKKNELIARIRMIFNKEILKSERKRKREGNEEAVCDTIRK